MTTYQLMEGFENTPVDQIPRGHGCFKVGQPKESQVVNLIEIEDMNDVGTLIENFLRSGERIEVVKSEETSVELRNRMMQTIMEMVKIEPQYHRVIVREYDSNVYLCRRAFWDGKIVPLEYADEIPEEIQNELGVRSGNKHRYINPKWYTTPLPTTEELPENFIEEIEQQFEEAELNRMFAWINDWTEIEVSHLK